MTFHVPLRRLRFYLTAHAPCPYLPGREERKVFAHIPMSEGAGVNDTLTQSGFRRSQNVAYRPACRACDACLSVRVPASRYVFSRTERRTLERNGDLTRHLVEAEATREQYDLLRRYLSARHAGAGMSDLSWLDYVAMVEDTTVRTHILEYRTASKDGGPGDLVAAVLVDLLSDGLSLVYSYYEAGDARRSLGSFMVLDHVVQARSASLPFVYLGYWVPGSEKMGYKSKFEPLEVLRGQVWQPVSTAEKAAPTPPSAPRSDPAAGLPVSARRRRTFGS